MTRFLERWLVPGLAVAIAAVQLYLTQTADLSPWKGGGFGMFAAIDAPSLRFVSAWGTDERDRPVQLDFTAELDGSTRRRLQSLPQQTSLEMIAEQFIDRPLVPEGFRTQRAVETVLAANPGVDLALSVPSNSQRDRFARASDPAVPASEQRHLRTLHLQWRRLRFEPNGNRLWVEALGPAVAIETEALQRSEP